MPRSGSASRSRVALGVAVAGIAVAALVAVPRGEPPVASRAGCPEPFPRLVLRLSPDSGSAGMGVCTDPAGTSTLVVNGGPAVWVVDGRPSSIRVRFNDQTRSFVDLVGDPVGVVPGGAAAVVLESPAEVTVRIDATLTVAQLVHDQLLRTLDRGRLAAAATAEGSSAARRALSDCLAAVLGRLPQQGDAVLGAREPADLIAGAATWPAIARGPCGESWRRAQVDAGLPAVDVRGFASDAVGWAEDADFVAQANGAARAYRGLQAEDAVSAAGALPGEGDR